MGFALMIAVAVLAGWLAERRGYTSVIYGTIAFLLYAGTAMWAGEEQRHQEAREALRVAAYGGVQREVPFEYGWPLLGAMAGIALPLMLPDRAGKQCPQCAERVKYAATVCRYCQHRFAAAGETTPPG